MRTLRVVTLLTLLALLGCASRAAGQDGARTLQLPLGYGSLTQNDVTLRMSNDELEIRFMPLHPQLAPLVAKDTYQALSALVDRHRREIDSVAARGGVAQPGVALVTFYGVRPDVRFDPQTLTLDIRNRVFRPLGTVPTSPKFTSGQLGVREQASALYVFEEDIPVNDSFTITYADMRSSDWRDKLSILDRERARVAARSRGGTRDTVKQSSAPPDSGPR